MTDSSSSSSLQERDPLTRLYNATTFYRKAEQLIAEAPDSRFEAVSLDIEHFKLFNAWHGREAGDAILVAIATRLRNIARNHQGLAGYLGGDDFALILPAGSVTEKIVDEQLMLPPLNTPETIGFQPALGVCTIDSPQSSIIEACDHAMMAMSCAKGMYNRSVAWYRTSMTEALEAEAKLLMEVRSALKNHEFMVYWQPQCNTQTGQIVGLEALVRWQHPERGLILPSSFVPVLEQSGFIASLDLYVWEEVCRQLHTWINHGIRPLPVSINISRADLHAIDVVKSISDLVERYNIDRSLLELEITESSYAEDERVSRAVRELRNLGFTVFMDDFGSGYSSLNMLKNVAVDVLKMDAEFLEQEHNPKQGESIFESVVAMTRQLGVHIIAEGAETKEQVDFLQSIGCKYAQGYYFYRPMDTPTLEKLMAGDTTIDYRSVFSQPAETTQA